MDESNTPLARARWRTLEGGLHAEVPESRRRGILLLVAVVVVGAWLVRFLVHLDGPMPVPIIAEVSIVLIGLTWSGVNRLAPKTTIAFEAGVFRCTSESTRESLELPLADVTRFEVEEGAEPHVLVLGGPRRSQRLPLQLGGAGTEAMARARAAAEALDAMRARASQPTA